VEVDEKVPHAALPQVADHVTPPFLLSLVTTAVRLVVVLTSRVVGGVGLNATERPGGAAVIAIVAEAVLVVSVTEVAVTVTVAGVGTVAGAV
jgi:hypothetical protein